MQNKRPYIIAAIILLLLLVPLLAMQFTDEVNWSTSDFVIAAIVLFVFGVLLEMILRFLNTRFKKIVASILLLLVFILVWIEIAVGVFGTPLAGT